MKTRLRWGDNGDEKQKKMLARENSDDDLLNKEEDQIFKVEIHR